MARVTKTPVDAAGDKGAEGTRELVVALVPERKQTNKPRKAQTVTILIA